MKKKTTIYKEMIISKVDKLSLKSGEVCPVCSKMYTKENVPVRTHCHLTGKYRA